MARPPFDLNTFWDYAIPEPNSGCVFWDRGWWDPIPTRAYGVLYMPGRRGLLKAHRVAWELTYGPIPNGLGVLHKCDTPPCINPAHLFLGTQADNNRDMSSKGRNANTKLNPAAIKMIQLCHGVGVKQRTLAGWYGVSQYAIWNAVHKA